MAFPVFQHKAKKVFEFLAEKPSVRIDYTPTYSSWLNQIEILVFQDPAYVISHGVFTSIKDLVRKLHALDPKLKQNGNSDPLDL